MAEKTPVARRPNVIVFLTDQQRWDTTGAHGNPLDLTPNFDAMAMSGTHAQYAFTPQPVCGPARACLQTGQYATTTGCFRNGIPLPADAQTLARCFKAGGYQTAYIGKWHLASTNTDPVPPHLRGGYEYWLAADTLELMSDAYDCQVYDAQEQRVKLPGYRADALTDAAIRYIDRHQQDPFFLFLSFLEPHHQNHRDDYPAPAGYAERYTARWTPPDLACLISEVNGLVGGNARASLGGYCGMIKRLDEALGRLQDALRSLGLLENTVIVFTSDHGCHFKTRNSEYKRSGHDSSIRVPLAISGPGFDGGGRLRQLVSLVDLPPTLLEAAGLPVPAQMQGRSIMPLLRGGEAAWPDEVFVQISESQVGRAIRTHRWKYGVVAAGANPRDAGSTEYEESYLYDLQSDPYELTNLVGLESHGPLCAHLRSALLRRMSEAGEAPATIAATATRPAVQRSVAPEEIFH